MLMSWSKVTRNQWWEQSRSLNVKLSSEWETFSISAPGVLHLPTEVSFVFDDISRSSPAFHLDDIICEQSSFHAHFYFWMSGKFRQSSSFRFELKETFLYQQLLWMRSRDEALYIWNSATQKKGKHDEGTDAMLVLMKKRFFSRLPL